MNDNNDEKHVEDKPWLESFDEYEDFIEPYTFFDKEMPEDMHIFYCSTGISEEAGEVAGKIKKVYRDHKGVFSDERKLAILAELGDVLYYVAALAKKLDFTLQDVAEANAQKIVSRARRGTLRGEGDDR